MSAVAPTGHVYRLLNNRMYIGEIVHKSESYSGEQEAIIERETWDKVQAILADNKPIKVALSRTKMMAPLKGVIRCGHCDCSMGPTYARKNDRQYTYYICEKDAKRTVSHCPLKRVRGRKQVVVPQALDGEIPEAAEPVQAAVIQALARAFSWAQILETGQVKSISELARNLEVDGSYVTRILKLTTLAPEIVEAIINGEESDGLSLAKLTRSFPEEWREQRSLFGFDDNGA